MVGTWQVSSTTSLGLRVLNVRNLQIAETKDHVKSYEWLLAVDKCTPPIALSQAVAQIKIRWRVLQKCEVWSWYLKMQKFYFNFSHHLGKKKWIFPRRHIVRGENWTCAFILENLWSLLIIAPIKLFFWRPYQDVL